jgi:dUTP pyrophosphatase
MLTVHFKRTHPQAVAPSKANASDSGYDLVLVDKIKEVDGVAYYDTGIQVAPPTGFYFDLVGRSSIAKTGYMLANNIGIIDNSYRGNIIVALVKINQDMPDLVLPARLVQIIPRKVWNLPFEDIGDQDLTATARGAGGFGSSGSYIHGP